MPSFLVKEIKPKDCYSIRHKVLWQHKSFDNCGIDIDDQVGSFHLGAYKADKLICVASFFKQTQAKFSEKNQYRLRAMATLSSAQNTGAARALLNTAFPSPCETIIGITLPSIPLKKIEELLSIFN